MIKAYSILNNICFFTEKHSSLLISTRRMTIGRRNKSAQIAFNKSDCRRTPALSKKYTTKNSANQKHINALYSLFIETIAPTQSFDPSLLKCNRRISRNVSQSQNISCPCICYVRLRNDYDFIFVYLLQRMKPRFLNTT